MTLPAIRLDFDGQHVMEVVTPGIPYSAGPPHRLDFDGVHIAPVASTTSTPYRAGPPVRLDFAGGHASDGNAPIPTSTSGGAIPSAPGQFPADFKAIVVLELLTGAKAPARASRDYGIDESVLRGWTEQFVERAAAVFEENQEDLQRNDLHIAELERALGRLALELDMTKRALAHARPPVAPGSNNNPISLSVPVHPLSAPASVGALQTQSAEKPRLNIPPISLSHSG